MNPLHQPRVLATDLDGTLIPIEGEKQSVQALEQIRGQAAAGELTLAYVSGRHLEFVFDAIIDDGLPEPDWILCDVGTSVYQRVASEQNTSGIDSNQTLSRQSLTARYRRSEEFDARLDEIIGDTDIERVRGEIAALDGFRLQESEKQGRHKLSYYVAAETLEQAHRAAEKYLETEGLPYGIIISVDPFNHDGLVDVLPRAVSKAFAVDWWCEFQNYQKEEIIFCGDSGNDYAALVAGYRSVVVANASRQLAAQVHRAHMAAGWNDRLLLASQPCTAGVLEGLRWFGFLGDAEGVQPSHTANSAVLRQHPPTERVERSEGRARREVSARPPRSEAGQPDNESCTTSAETVETAGDQGPPQEFPLPWGATPSALHRTDFHVFAPEHDALTLCWNPPASHGDAQRQVEMDRDARGLFTARAEDCPIGSLYQFQLGGQSDNLNDERSFVSDPASRFQPEGVHGRSQVVSGQFPWQHDQTPRCDRVEDLIIYELHIGSFTKEGTFGSAIERLDELVDLGITAIELMPIAQCPGRWNWGYDATHWFAPMQSLGTPEDMRRFVDAAHARGLSVFLDVVYNHYGPEGNYWGQLGNYFSQSHHTPWGSAPNFDHGEESQLIRRFVIDNAIYWLDEFRLDGLRVDAIHCMGDDSEEHITQQFGREVREWSRQQGRRIWLIAETNVYDESMTAPLEQGGCGFDAQWGDDFAHALLACVRSHDQLTVRSYQPHVDLARAIHRGFVFQGDVRGDRGREENAHREVVPQRVDTSSLIYCIQNHDFIGNHPLGKRFHQITSPQTQAAAASLLFLSPAVPMLFMGEEFACENPFAFFVDFSDEELRQSVIEGRRRDYPQHDWSGGVLPTQEQAFHDAGIGPAHAGNPEIRAWYRELIRVRKQYTQSGLLAGEHLETIADTARGVYVLKFCRAEEQLTLVCRLGEESGGARPQADTMTEREVAELLGIDHELPQRILDSRVELGNPAEAPFCLHANHAIVLATG